MELTQTKAKKDVYLALEFTPNPNTLKYAVNFQILDPKIAPAKNFTSIVQAEKDSPLATKLLKTTGISAVMIGTHFVTITKEDAGDWDLVHQTAMQTIQDHLENDEPVVIAAPADIAPDRQKTDIESKIIDVLDAEIRPAVAMDGGDISLDRVEDGIVYLHLQGSCAGCPSSTITLKQGIETRLKELFPEVKEVVSV